MAIIPINIPSQVSQVITNGVTDKAPSEDAVFDALAAKQAALGFTPENIANKQTDLTASATKYPTVNAVNTGLALKQNSLGYTAENAANKDASGGYVGLTLFKINFKNVLNTFTSFFTNSNTAARTYTFQDRNGIIADDTDLATKTDKLISINTQTASYTLVLADADKLVRMNVASANNLTVPLNSTVAYPIGAQILIEQMGAGQTTIVATGGVTIRSYLSALKLSGQYAKVSLIKVGTDEWTLAGNLSV